MSLRCRFKRRLPLRDRFLQSRDERYVRKVQKVRNVRQVDLPYLPYVPDLKPRSLLLPIIVLYSHPLPSLRIVSALPLFGALGLACVLGYGAGRIVSAPSFSGHPPITVAAETREGVPVVLLDRIVNGELRGSVKGEARLFLADRLVTVESGSFRVPASELLTNFITVEIPPGMRFVASKRGTYYYRVDSSNGDAIVPGNRVYFRDEESAKAAGYVSHKKK